MSKEIPIDDWSRGYAAAMREAASIMRETSRLEIEGRPGDIAYPLGAVGRWFRDHAALFEERAASVEPPVETLNK